MAILIGYIGACTIWLNFKHMTAIAGPIGTTLRMISSTELIILSAVNAVAFLALGIDLVTWSRRGSLFRRSQMCGGLLGVATLAVLQWVVMLTYSPTGVGDLF